jgi:hypothetical protein
MDKGTDEDAAKARLEAPFSSLEIKGQNAAAAYGMVLQHAGASFRRDTLDERIINDVKNRTGKFIDVQGGYPHGTGYAQSMTAWPLLKTLTPAPDGDKDGMPDEWEKKNGLNPSDASDASGYKLDTVYTNIEVFINSITGSDKLL